MTSYTVASLTHTGEQVPHPDVSQGSGIDVAKTALGSSGTKALLAAAMQGTPGFYTRELLLDSDCVAVNVEDFIISFYRDYQMSKFWASYAARSEAVTSGGTKNEVCPSPGLAIRCWYQNA